MSNIVHVEPMTFAKETEHVEKNAMALVQKAERLAPEFKSGKRGTRDIHRGA